LFPFRFFNYRMSRSRTIPAGLSPDRKKEIQPMRGKFTQMMSWSRLHDLAGLLGASGDPLQDDEAQIRTPMRFARVIRLGADGRHETVPIRWGFADARAKTPLKRPRHVHARAATIDRLPTFADAFAHERGLVLVKTFNAGEELPNGRGAMGDYSTRRQAARARDHLRAVDRQERG
jgi:putative SOS response-associated peptidase YedK